MAVTIEELLIALKYKVDVKALEDAEKKAVASAEAQKRAFDTLGSTLTKVGVSMVGFATAVVGLSAKAAAAGANIDDISKRSGVAAKEIQSLAFALEQSGGSIQDLESSFKFLQKAIADARTGTGPAYEAFKNLGKGTLEAVEKTTSTSEKLKILANGFANLTDEVVETDTVTAIFGRGGLVMLPVLNEGAEGIKRFADEAERAGVVLSDDTIAAAAAFDDELAKLKSQLTAVTTEMGAKLIPVIKDAVKNWDDWKNVIIAFGVAWGAMKLDSAVASVGSMVTHMKSFGAATSLARGGVLGLVVAVGSLAYGITAALDEWLGMTDAMAGVKNTKKRRGGGAHFGDLTEEEKAELKTLQDKAVVREDIDSGTRTGGLSESEQRQLDAIQARGQARKKQREADEVQARRQGEADVHAMAARNQDMIASQIALVPAKKTKKSSGGTKDATARKLAEAMVEMRTLGLDEELEQIGVRHGAKQGAIQDAIKSAATQLAEHSSAKVAREAGLSTLSSKTGIDVGKRQRDPLLAEIFGNKEMPDVALSDLERGQQPQVLISTINNTFNVNAPISLGDVGSPQAAASGVQDAVRSLFSDEIQRVSKFSKVVFRR